VERNKKGPLATRFVRNPNKEEFDNGKFLVYTNGPPKYNYDNSEYVPVPVKAGDAILIDGLVVHRSSANLSPSSRHIYTFHVYEGDNSVFSANNWYLKQNEINLFVARIWKFEFLFLLRMEPSEVSFLPLYEN
jgi:ectoine hydroxylase-related dioxygenase (phytanoyl-CoA dioxygenase family)